MTDRDRRIVDNLPLARAVAGNVYKRWRRFGEYDDFLQHASIGLIQAAQTYDPGAGASFTTWAMTCCWSRCMEMIQTAIHRHRRGRRMVALSDGIAARLADQRVTASDAAEDREERAAAMRRVRRAMPMLSERQRQAILEMAAGVRPHESAARRGTSRQAIDQAQKAGLKRLREVLVD